MTWKLLIEEPSGGIKTRKIEKELWIGRSDQVDILLRDPTAAPYSVRLTPRGENGFWAQVPEDAPELQILDLKVRSALIPRGIPFKVGETRLKILPQENSPTLPEQPNGMTHWLSCSDEGRKVLWTIKKAAPTQLSIYLAGETGTGKEILAHLIHSWSDRSEGLFIPLHCGALSLSLAESELFGHEKGSFTGAYRQRPGALLQAHGGTLFLDEIGDLSLELQVKLLRFLENGEIRPVGSDRLSKADVRIICATHHSLEQLVEQGKFRQDLYYRLASVTVPIPPLRERPEDIELLSKKFAHDLNRVLLPQSVLRLQAHRWPGNVRELRHCIERAAGLSGPFEKELGEEAFSFLSTPQNVLHTPEVELGAPVLTLFEMERIMILKALRIAKGHRGVAAKILGIARSTLFERLKKHRIAGPRSGLQPPKATPVAA